jgi:hypothetical protein
MDLAIGPKRLMDLMGDAAYDRDGDDLQRRGLLLDRPPWHASIFSLHRLG